MPTHSREGTLDRPPLYGDLLLPGLLARLGLIVRAGKATRRERVSQTDPITRLVQIEHRYRDADCSYEVDEEWRTLESPRMRDISGGFWARVQIADGTQLRFDHTGGYRCHGPDEERVLELVEALASCC